MRYLLGCAVLLASCGPAVAQDEPDTKIAERDLREFKAMLPGTYTNEEQTYFQENLDMDASQRLPRLTLTITPDGDDFIAQTQNPATGRQTEARLSYRVEDGQIKSIETRASEPNCERVFTRNFDQFRGEGCGGDVIASPDGFTFGATENPFVMHRARAFSCWVSPKKADESFGFYNNLQIHDQGGRIWVEGEGHPRVGLKMRNVQWPTGRNRDSLVLYAYRGDDEDKAVSYAWTSPDGKMLALNLRWMQASCTVKDN